MTNTPICIYDSPNIHNAYLIVSTTFRSKPKTYVFSIDKNTGGIYHAGIPNVDIFPNQESAKEYLISICEFQSEGKGSFENIGQSLIGATIFDNKLAIICVQEHKQITTIFNQNIYLISEVSYTIFDLNPKSVFAPTTGTHIFLNSYSQLNSKLKKSSFLKFDLRQTHFYCPTLDLNSKFPYPRDVISNGIFCWNKKFLTPFENNNCLDSCIIVFQGGVYSFSKGNASITYVIKRSSMYPGTRYNSRGLRVTVSHKVETANECECDLIFSDGQYYYSQTWRRGSLPIFWKTETRGLSVSHVISKDAEKKTSSYFYQQIIKRFRPSKIHIFSLLKDKSNNERIFNDVYETGCGLVTFNSMNNETVKFVFTRFDLNTLEEETKEDQRLIGKKIFEKMENSLESSNFTRVDINTGKIVDSTSSIESSFESVSSSNDIDSMPTIDDQRHPKVKNLDFSLIPQNCPNRQSVLFRFNCVDSLDRTNVGTFFFGVILTAKFTFQCNIPQFMNKKARQITSKSGTFWKKPLDYLSEDVIEFLQLAFIDSGHIISHLYTNTKAIKSRLIEKVTCNGQASSTELTDKLISLQRRIENIFKDPQRHNAIEEWTRTHNVRNPRFVLDHKYISLCEMKQCGRSILEPVARDFILDSAGSIDVMFPEPLFVYQVSLLILRRNISDNVTMTLQIGNNKSAKAVFFKDLLIPTINDKNSIKKPYANDCYVWATYNLRKIAKYSNLLPVDPESLRPATFVSIQFHCPNKMASADSQAFRIGNIRFVVKKPTKAVIKRMMKLTNMSPHEASQQLLDVKQKDVANHRYMITGNPKKIEGNSLSEVVANTCNEALKAADKDYFSLSKTECKQSDVSVLPKLDDLVNAMMKWIKYGISDFNNYRTFVRCGANPWIFDIGSRISAQTNKNVCPICGKKTNASDAINAILNRNNLQQKGEEKEENDDREALSTSTVYMPNPIFPQFYLKTINADEISKNKNVTFLCKECSGRYAELMSAHRSREQAESAERGLEDEESFLSDNENVGSDDEFDLGDSVDDLAVQSEIISSNSENFVKINDVSDLKQVVLPATLQQDAISAYVQDEPTNLSNLARVYEFPPDASCDALNAALHHEFAKSIGGVQHIAHLSGSTSVTFSVCFAVPVTPTDVRLFFSSPPGAELELELNAPEVGHGGVEVARSGVVSDESVAFDVTIMNGQSLQSLVFVIKRKDGGDLSLHLSGIDVLGFVPAHRRTVGDGAALLESRSEQVQLKNFEQTGGARWNPALRTQTFTGDKVPKSVSGFAVRFQPGGFVPRFFVLAFLAEKKVVHMIPVVLPSELSETAFLPRDPKSKGQGSSTIDSLYFPVSDQIHSQFDFDTISVFYIEKSASLTPLSFMFY